VHYRLIVRDGSREGRGSTENVSERGAMISIDLDPPLRAGGEITLDVELPERGFVQIPARVRWISSVLPGMAGIEFLPPVNSELVAHIAQLLNQRIDQTG